VTGKGVGRRVRATDIFESLIAYCPWGLLLLGIHVFLVHRCVCVCAPVYLPVCAVQYCGSMARWERARYGPNSSTLKSRRVGGKSRRLGSPYIIVLRV